MNGRSQNGRSHFLSEYRKVGTYDLTELRKWIMMVCNCLAATTVVLQRTIELFNRLNRKLNIRAEYLKLSGLVCFYVSDSLFRSYPVDPSDLIKISGGDFDEEDFIKMMEIFLENIRLEFEPPDIFHVFEPGKIERFRIDFMRDGEYYNASKALRAASLVVLDTTEFSIEDISYFCDGILDARWSNGRPEIIFSAFSKGIKHIPDIINSTSRSLISRALKKSEHKSEYKSEHESDYDYTPPVDLDKRSTGFISGSVHENYLIRDAGNPEVFQGSHEGKAIKKFDAEFTYVAEDFLRELRCYQIISSDYIPTYFRSSLNSIEMEKCELDLKKMMEVYEPNKLESLRIMLDICFGLRDIHGKGIIHCDLSDRNVMRCHTCYKIIDFGISEFHNMNRERNWQIQTLAFRAPEIVLIDDYPEYDQKIDIWSLGALYYFIRKREYLVYEEYDERDIGELKLKISSLDCPIFKSCLSFDPNRRPTVYTIIGLLEDSYPEIFQGINREI